MGLAPWGTEARRTSDQRRRRCSAAVTDAAPHTPHVAPQIWVGRQTMSAGRAGEAASTGLTERLLDLGFETDRLKTGTPARVDRRTVNFSGALAGGGMGGGEVKRHDA